MAHTYTTTYSRHNAYHGLRFSIAALTMAGTVGCFTVHWGLGVAAILPMMLLSGYINSFLDARATYLYLKQDCGIAVTYSEARKWDYYFSPNHTGRWLALYHLRALPIDQRREAMLTAMADFDERHTNTPASTPNDNRQRGRHTSPEL